MICALVSGQLSACSVGDNHPVPSEPCSAQLAARAAEAPPLTREILTGSLGEDARLCVIENANGTPLVATHGVPSSIAIEKNSLDDWVFEGETPPKNCQDSTNQTVLVQIRSTWFRGRLLQCSSAAQ